MKAQLLTIGTEITCGEVINTNASWVSRKLENIGIRVQAHLSVRDQREEMLGALKFLTQDPECEIVIVTGGLGPTTDDITRNILSEWTKRPLEFDDSVWQELVETYGKRGLILRESHKQQCLFPKDCDRLRNPVGTALGFYQKFEGRHYFILPGPPRELEEMWSIGVAPRLEQLAQATSYRWQHWTNIGIPESEIAELVESVIGGKSIEVGYRASIPYVRTKLYLDSTNSLHQKVQREVSEKLAFSSIGTEDLAERFLRSLSGYRRLHIQDEVTGVKLAQRLFTARDTTGHSIDLSVGISPFNNDVNKDQEVTTNTAHLKVTNAANGFKTELRLKDRTIEEVKELPYRISLKTDRGRTAATEWILWSCLK